MASKVKGYQKLPGVKKGFLIGKFSLWQGGDHLLYIFSRFGAEDYKRFYFNDIQAIITRKTVIGRIQNIIMGSFILMFLLPVFFFDGGWSVFYGVICGLTFIFLLINFFKGPTCETKLLTAVQAERLQSLNRLKTACRVMDRLRPHIQQVQGVLKPEDLAKLPVRPADRRAPKTSGKAAAPGSTGRIHLIMFSLILFEGALAALEFFTTNVISSVFGSLAGLCIGICVILALVKQHNSGLAGPIRVMTWICLGYVCVTFAAGYVVGIVYAMKNPGLAYNQWELIKSVSGISPWESPLKMSHNIMVICSALFLGIPGLIILVRSKRKVRIPAAGRLAPSGRPVIPRNMEAG
jgi:hypothetical protein